MVWIGKFKREEQTIDYTDAGKNVPEIKTSYGVTKEGFIEFKANSENRINLDFENNQLSSNINTDISSNNISTIPNSSSSGGMFDFLDSPSSVSNTNISNSMSSLFQSPPSPNAFNPPSPESVNNPEINKLINRISSRVEENSNEVYNLLQRIEMLERKISDLENKSF